MLEGYQEKIVFKKFIFIVISYIFIQLGAFAAERNTTISIDVGKDEQGNTNSLVSADMGLRNSKRIFFGVGNSKIPSGTEIIDNSLAFVGLSKKFSDHWKLTGMLEYSGLKNAYTLFSASAGMRFSTNSVFVELVPALRRIKLTTIGNKHLFVGSAALGLKTGVHIGDHFRLSGSAYTYTYSDDVSQLASFASTRFFNEKTLLLSSGLLEKAYNVETGLDFESFSVSIGKNQSVSAIDFSDSDYVYSVFDYYFSEAWSMSVFLGKYLNTPSDQDNFSSLSVNYSF